MKLLSMSEILELSETIRAGSNPMNKKTYILRLVQNNRFEQKSRQFRK
jgi:hypothetical protein